MNIQRLSKPAVFAISRNGGACIDAFHPRVEDVRASGLALPGVENDAKAAFYAIGAHLSYGRVSGVRRVRMTRGEGFPELTLNPKTGRWSASGTLARPAGRLP